MRGAASGLLEEALRAKYPDLSKAMIEKMAMIFKANYRNRIQIQNVLIH